MTLPELKHILEGALLAHGNTLSITDMQGLFEQAQVDDYPIPGRRDIVAALESLSDDLSGRGIELVNVASGYRLQVRTTLMPWVSRLWDEKPPRYSRALLETLALIAYRQPVTRGDIEEVRGVSVSTGIIKTLMERGWVKIVGHRDVPGRPSLFATTPAFLDYFGLKALDELPTLMAIQELGDAHQQLNIDRMNNTDTPLQADVDVSDNNEADATAGSLVENDVLDATAAELEAADVLVRQVETNLFGESATDGSRPKRFGDLIDRLTAVSDDAEEHANNLPDTPHHEAAGHSKSEKE